MFIGDNSRTVVTLHQLWPVFGNSLADWLKYAAASNKCSGLPSSPSWYGYCFNQPGTKWWPSMHKFSFGIDTRYTPARSPRLRTFDHIEVCRAGSAGGTGPFSGPVNRLWNILDRRVIGLRSDSLR